MIVASSSALIAWCAKTRVDPRLKIVSPRLSPALASSICGFTTFAGDAGGGTKSTRASAMAAWLFGRPAPVPEVKRPRPGFLPWRAVDAARAHRRLVRDTRAGLLAPALGPRPLLATNARPDGARWVRTLVRHRSQLPGPTVTVGVLAAVSTALSGLLGDAADSLGAEVPMAKTGVPQAHNHFGNIVVGLYPGLGLGARIERIATDLANGRRRFEHLATRSADRAFAAVPAALLRWGISQFDADARPAQQGLDIGMAGP